MNWLIIYAAGNTYAVNQVIFERHKTLSNFFTEYRRERERERRDRKERELDSCNLHFIYIIIGLISFALKVW